MKVEGRYSGSMVGEANKSSRPADMLARVTVILRVINLLPRPPGPVNSFVAQGSVESWGNLLYE